MLNIKTCKVVMNIENSTLLCLKRKIIYIFYLLLKVDLLESYLIFICNGKIYSLYQNSSITNFFLFKIQF